MKYRSRKEPGNDGLLLINTNFLEIRSGEDEEKLQSGVQGVFEWSFRVPNKETFASDELKAFGQVNAVFKASHIGVNEGRHH